jgi:hypothetical protein
MAEFAKRQTIIQQAVAAAATIFFSAWDHLFRAHP